MNDDGLPRPALDDDRDSRINRPTLISVIWLSVVLLASLVPVFGRLLAHLPR